MKYILPLDRPVKSKMVILTTAGAGKNFLMWLILGWKRKPAEENEQYQKEGPHFFDNKKVCYVTKNNEYHSFNTEQTLVDSWHLNTFFKLSDSAEPWKADYHRVQPKFSKERYNYAVNIDTPMIIMCHHDKERYIKKICGMKVDNYIPDDIQLDRFESPDHYDRFAQARFKAKKRTMVLDYHEFFEKQDKNVIEDFISFVKHYTDKDINFGWAQKNIKQYHDKNVELLDNWEN